MFLLNTALWIFFVPVLSMLVGAGMLSLFSEKF